MGDSGPGDSQVGDDPAFEDDEGVGYGNVDTTTQEFQEDTRQENQRSNIIGDPNYDAQFTADNIESRFGEGTAKNFMSPENYAQTTQAARDSGLPSVSIDIPSIQAASSPLAPGILGETLSDFQSGVRPDTGRRPMGFDTPANEMLEAAIGTTVGIPNVSRETIVDRGAFLSPGQLFPSLTIQSGIRGVEKDQSNIRRQLQNIGDQLNFGMGDPGNPTRNPINFGVTQQLLPTTTPIAKPVDRIAAMTMPGTAMGTTQQEGGVSTVGDDFAPALDMVDARTQDTSIVGDDFQPALDMVDARTTATGTTGTFDPEAENLMDSTFLDTTPYKEGTAVADIKLRDAPFDENLNLFGLQIPNLAGRALNFGAEKLNDRLFDAIVKKPSGEVLRDKDGRIIGVMDETNSFLIEGMPGLDSKGQMRGQMQEEQGGDNESQRKVAPKAPTDPCPDGYQLIDGKCTPTGATDTGTEFMMFPTDRTPPFRTGPFTPTTVATNPNIRALNPVTFGLSNIFRR